VLVPVGELERLEHLCRYITRPPLATQRLALAPNGRVIYGLKRHWRDGTSAVSFDPLTFIERLAALVPPPRAHQLAYHGVLATASAWRDLVVPKRARHSAAHPPTANPRDTLGSGASPAPGAATRSRSSRSTWAELLRRVFAVDVLTCPLCGGPRRLIAQLTDPVVVRKILGSSRTAHRASTARAGPLARTARLRLSRRSYPVEPNPRPPLAPPSRLARSQSARATAPRAPHNSPARVPWRARVSGCHLTDRRPAANLHLAGDDDRLQRNSFGVELQIYGSQARAQADTDERG
jgi:hypothetical protein